MSSFRTSVLFRFTRDFDSFVRVLKTGIYPNYCEEDLSFGDEEFVIGIPMICFCDIPITLLDEQTTRYGLYGIGLSKEWGIENGITPVMYVANDDVLRAMYYQIEEERVLDRHIHSAEFRRRAYEGLIKGSILSEYAAIANAKTKHEVNTHMAGYMKKYKGVYKQAPIVNYLENEWRYLVPDTDATKWMWSEEEYAEWRFPNGKNGNPPKPAPSDALKKYGLTFIPSDVKYILVKNDVFKRRVIKLIQNSETFRGNKLTGKGRTDLMAKIITMTQVKEDF